MWYVMITFILNVYGAYFREVFISTIFQLASLKRLIYMHSVYIPSVVFFSVQMSCK